MNKKRLVYIGTLLVFLAVLTGVCFSDRHIPKSTSAKKTGDTRHLQTQTEEITEYGNMDFEEAEQAISDITANASVKVFSGYPVDESFFVWLGSEYGTDMLAKLADRMKKENAGADVWYEMMGKSIHVVWSEYCRDHFASSEWTDIIWKEPADSSCIRLDFIGDINFDSNCCTMKAAGDSGHIADCISEDIRNELQSADFTMVNNEFVYTKVSKAQDKEYVFRADPETVSALEVFGTDMVSIANNHVFDFGEQGFSDTLETLEKNKIVYSGGGRNLKEASAVRYVIIGGRKIAVVSATEIERFSHYTKKAGEHTPGVLKTQQTKALFSAIRTAEKNSDYVIAYMHWGAEGAVKCDREQNEIAKQCAKAGADAVIGGHPHRMQGVSFVEGTPVAYSLGNFWFSTGTLYTAIAQIQIDDKGELSLRMLPCVQKNMKTSLLGSEEEKKEFYHYLADVSTGVGIDEDGRIHAYKDVNMPGESPYAYTSGRRYGLRFDNVDLDMRLIDFVGNIEEGVQADN